MIVPRTGHPSQPWILLAGLSCAAVVDGINGTVLSIAQAQMMGASRATPDEFAWMNIAYFAAKLAMFPLAPWLCMRAGYRRTLFAAISLLLASSLACGMTRNLGELVMWRTAQGTGGGALLVAAQSLLFQVFPKRHQPLVQGALALALVMVPVGIAPAVEGWLTDGFSWSWIFLLSLPFGAAGAASLLAFTTEPSRCWGRFDWPGATLLAVAAICLVFVLQQGNRYDWFEEPRIVYLSIAGLLALTSFVAWEIRVQKRGGLVEFDLFRNQNFVFGYVVSFVAGCALFGSAFIIPAFALSVIDLGPMHAGLLLLPGSAPIGVGLLVAGGLMQWGKAPPLIFVPIGIVCFMTAMCMLSGLTVESGMPDMATPLLLRGLGLGFLFVPLTMITLGGLRGVLLPHGVGLFNLGRQLGGLIGTAWLSTWIERQSALGSNILASNLSSGNPALAGRQEMAAALLEAQGYGTDEATAAAMMVIKKAVQAQVAVLSFNEAFLALALLFVAAVPVLISIKIAQTVLARRGTS